jgi:dTMP kinase
MDGTFERRGGFGEERYETVELQRKVRRQYGLLHEDWWSIIDATGTVDEIHAACLRVVIPGI